MTPAIVLFASAGANERHVPASGPMVCSVENPVSLS